MKDRSGFMPQGCNQRWTIRCDGGSCNYCEKQNTITLFKRDFAEWLQILEKAGWKTPYYLAPFDVGQHRREGTYFLCPSCAKEHLLIPKTTAIVCVKAAKDVDIIESGCALENRGKEKKSWRNLGDREEAPPALGSVRLSMRGHGEDKT